MQVAVFIEPTTDGSFRAEAGAPFNVSAEGKTAHEATQRLESILREQLRSSGHLAVIDLGNESHGCSDILQLPVLPEDDWFFQSLRESIAEYRQQEDEAAR